MGIKKGFTLAEVLLITAIIGVIALALLAATDPFEQIKKGRDTTKFQTSNDVYTAIIRFQATKRQAPYTTDVEGVSLNSPEGETIINNLVNTGELKTTFSKVSSAELSQLYFTGATDLSYFTVCFLPISKSYKGNTQAIYNKYGIPTNCNENDCYICSGVAPPPTAYAAIQEKISTCKQIDAECEINNSNKSCCSGLQCIVYNSQSGAGKCRDILTPTAPPTSSPTTTMPPGTPTSTSSTVTPTPTPSIPEELYCEGFDPEKPLFPWTCNYSSKWSMYKCTNYCVADKGCDSYCPAGQRHLIKDYYATGINLFSCLLHRQETIEDYCVSGDEANCSNKPYRSYEEDFLWGCTNPRRPYAWK